MLRPAAGEAVGDQRVAAVDPASAGRIAVARSCRQPSIRLPAQCTEPPLLDGTRGLALELAREAILVYPQV